MPNIEIAKNKNANNIIDKNKYISVLYKNFPINKFIINYISTVKYLLLNCQNKL